MSFVEVKKINSDMSVPLDERLTYVGGIIPRGLPTKRCTRNVIANTASGHVVNTPMVTTLMDAEGRGWITDFKFSVSKAKSYVSAALTVTIYVDDEVFFTFAATIPSYNNNGGNASVEVITDNFNSYSNRGALNRAISLTTSADNPNINPSYTIDLPIRYEKSAKVVVSEVASSLEAITTFYETVNVKIDER